MEHLWFPRRKWQPTPVLLPAKSHGPRSLVGYSPWGRKESDMTEQLHFTFNHYSRWTLSFKAVQERLNPVHIDLYQCYVALCFNMFWGTHHLSHFLCCIWQNMKTSEADNRGLKLSQSLIIMAALLSNPLCWTAERLAKDDSITEVLFHVHGKSVPTAQKNLHRD